MNLWLVISHNISNLTHEINLYDEHVENINDRNNQPMLFISINMNIHKTITSNLGIR